MTIEKLSEEKVLVSLCEEDMESFRLNKSEMGFYDERSRRSLIRLLQVACREAGMSAVSKTVLMEALPLQSGCLFLLTFTDRKTGKTYRVKKSGAGACYVFSDAEKLLSAAETSYLNGIVSKDMGLWIYNSIYYLIFDNPLIKSKMREVLEHYAQKMSVTAPGLSRIKEGGKLLCAENALYAVGKIIYTKDCP